MKEILEINENMNILRKRYIQWFNCLTKEQQIAIKEIDNLPKDRLYLKKIRRLRNPKVTPGDIFAMHLPEDIFFYGKVLQKADNLPMIDPGFFVVLVSNITTKEMTSPSFEINEDTFLTGPWIVDEGLWKNGTFFTVGHTEPTGRENSLDIVFEKALGNNRFGYFDRYGNAVNRECAIMGHSAYTTLYGIEREIRKQIIAGKINTELVNDEF